MTIASHHACLGCGAGGGAFSRFGAPLRPMVLEANRRFFKKVPHLIICVHVVLCQWRKFGGLRSCRFGGARVSRLSAFFNGAILGAFEPSIDWVSLLMSCLLCGHGTAINLQHIHLNLCCVSGWSRGSSWMMRWAGACWGLFLRCIRPGLNRHPRLEIGTKEICQTLTTCVSCVHRYLSLIMCSLKNPGTASTERVLVVTPHCAS